MDYLISEMFLNFAGHVEAKSVDKARTGIVGHR
jgi:hypothetical protein